MIIKIRVKGAVQGVGYRPFVLKKATEYGLSGYVKNIGAAVDILISGDESRVNSFTHMIRNEHPSGAFILDVEKIPFNDVSVDEAGNLIIDEKNEDDSIIHTGKFRILNSSEVTLKDQLPVFLPDIGICDDCLNEMLDKKDRRYGYPLISCAGCGPRISILDKLPYDRDNTVMRSFKMCSSCGKDYLDGRRRHAQTISCFDCGPQYYLKFYDSDGNYKILDGQDAVLSAITALKKDEIIGLKGMSGYQLIGRPDDNAALLLRHCKGRENKPFAVMFSTIFDIRKYCFVSEREATLLQSSARPIVLLRKRYDFSYEVCKDSRYIGAFLPSCGIHRILCDEVGPLIVTSANISDEPIIISEEKFDERFKNSIKYCLFHKRKINIPQDDSVAFVTELSENSELISFNRRSRGYFPLPLMIKRNDFLDLDKNILAFGGDLKNTFSIARKERIITSPFLGDLKGLDIKKNSEDLRKKISEIFDFNEDIIICDMHPLYFSTRMAKELSEFKSIPLYQVQHHHAHILSVMAEKSLYSCIGIAFDGTGYGTDQKIWGGEILYCNEIDFSLEAKLSYIKLCGGDNAPKNAQQVKECYFYAKDKNDKKISPLVKAALDNNIGTYDTSSVGRLFDAVASLLEIKHFNSFEGECAIALEKEAWKYYDNNKNNLTAPDISILLVDNYYFDQTDFFDKIRKLYESNIYDISEIAFSFHRALADAIRNICIILRDKYKENNVCLSGGVFGNRLLLKLAFENLRSEDFDVYTNEMVPCGDSGISLGQAYYGLMLQKRK